jgi:hypothetical protein
LGPGRVDTRLGICIFIQSRVGIDYPAGFRHIYMYLLRKVASDKNLRKFWLLQDGDMAESPPLPPHRTQIGQQFSTVVETNCTQSTTLAHQGLDPDVKLAYHSNNSSVRHQTEIGQPFSTIVETNFTVHRQEQNMCNQIYL